MLHGELCAYYRMEGSGSPDYLAQARHVILRRREEFLFEGEVIDAYLNDLRGPGRDGEESHWATVLASMSDFD